MSDPSSITGVIAAAEGGRVTFGRFMELALTHPDLGYYSRADRLLRHGGDFNTAPALSPFFNRTVARLVTELLDASLALETAAAGAEGAGASERGPGGAGAADPHAADPQAAPLTALPLTVVELGGGEGHLAAAILAAWEHERPDLKARVGYRIVEVGEKLRQRQAEALAGAIAAGWDVGWGGTLTEACAGSRPVVMVGNEFMDTVPAHMVRTAGGALSEAYVGAGAAGLEQTWGPLSPEVAAELQSLFGTLDSRRPAAFTEDGVVEVFPGLKALYGEITALMPAGSLVTIDYGEWFPGVPQPEGRPGPATRGKRRRTVRGYFKQQMVADVLARAGGQDLTADVDFAALDLHGRHEGWETVLFTSLTAFLLAGGAQAELEALGCGAGSSGLEAAGPGGDSTLSADALEADRRATVLRNLLDERDLGGTFKLMVQVREGS